MATDSAFNLSLLRDRNDAAVLRAVRARGGAGVSRVELAAETGLTAQAISKIAARLLDEGLLAEAGRERVAGATGKPRTLLRLVPDARVALGAQLGREELRLLRVDLAGTVTGQARATVDLRGEPGPVLDQLAQMASELTSDVTDGQVLGLGLAAPGPLDAREGVLHHVTGLPRWRGLRLREEMQARCGLPVVVEKNTTAGVLSQLGSDNRAFVYLGDGVGAGLVLGGRVQRGARTNAGEFGHQCVDRDGPLCACGARGCLEAVCLTALRAGRAEEAAQVLGVGVANLVRLLDVDEVSLGGGRMLDAVELFEDAIRAELASRVPDGTWQTVTLSRAPRLAIPLGAAGLAMAHLFH
ncbi:ROK family transcriptional regulator [Streptacidiphilus monticola]|uniref:ROK family protein n=1 Tax=Streptacidiphilus monticola TaxID=2161674 RepID=A0ABW1G6W1_9ACTN